MLVDALTPPIRIQSQRRGLDYSDFLPLKQGVGIETIVTYWPLTQPSIKRCTCVNKRKNSGSRWAANKNITRTQTAWVSWSWSQWGTRCQRESQRQTEGFGPSVTDGWAIPAKMRKKCYYGQKNLGLICSSLSRSPTHFSHTTNINPFGNKLWEL